MGNKTWFVSYRLKPRPRGSGHSRRSQTFENEAEAKSFARTLPSSDVVNAGTINPHMPKRFIGSSLIHEWLAKEPTDNNPD
jgi:hypothetical protein